MHEDGCDNCGNVRELYHFDAVVAGNPDDGAALCDDCNSEANAWDAAHGEAEVGQFHGEINRLREDIAALLDEDGADTTGVTRESLTALDAQAEQLLRLPEESVAALVEAARLMVGAAEYGR